MQVYCASRYLGVPGHASPNILLDASIIQSDLLLHLLMIWVCLNWKYKMTIDVAGYKVVGTNVQRASGS